jgi:diadenosine tetraphosphate (Ap4A) HIT family hydrolase
MAFSEHVRDALCRVHAGTRALKIARDVQDTHHRLALDFADAGFLIDDVTEALVQQLQEAEADLAALIAAAGGSITDPVHGHVLAMRANDRREDARPLFVLTRLHHLGAASPSRYAQRVRA